MHPAEPQDELLQCYDENGNPTEGRPRSQTKKRPEGWYYGIATIWLVNDRGQILCSKRAEKVSWNPGRWQTYFGGHVPFGISFLQTALKELREEAGIEATEGDLVLIKGGRDEGFSNFFRHYAIRFNGEASDLVFTDGEVTEAKWMDMDEYWKDREANPNKWCNACRPEEQMKIKAWIRA